MITTCLMGVGTAVAGFVASRAPSGAARTVVATTRMVPSAHAAREPRPDFELIAGLSPSSCPRRPDRVARRTRPAHVVLLPVHEPAQARVLRVVRHVAQLVRILPQVVQLLLAGAVRDIEVLLAPDG